MEMTVGLGEIAGLIAALAFVVLVVFLIAVPLTKLGRVLTELQELVKEVNGGTGPILSELKGTVTATNTEIEKLSVVTEDAAKVSANAAVVSENAAQMATLFAATLGGPLVRTAAFTYGVRQALRRRGRVGTSRRGR